MAESKILEPQGEIVIKDVTGSQIGKWDPQMVETIKNTVAKDATDTELQVFAQVCANSGLDPFMKEIWFVKYGNEKPAIMTGRDGYLKIANMDPNYLGVQAFGVYENDTFKVSISKGKVQDVKHDFEHVNRGNLLGAWAVAEKQGKRPVYTYVKFEDFVQYKKSGEVNKFWKTKSESMIKKVAEADVLKRICGISGLNAAETMSEEYSQDYIDAEYTVKDTTKEEKEDLEEIQDIDEIATTMQTKPDPITVEPVTDELAEGNYEKIKIALKVTNKELNLENIEKKAKWFAKNKNHPQFDENMVNRVMDIAEKALDNTQGSENNE